MTELKIDQLLNQFRLHLLRHGEVVVVDEPRLNGQTDVQLTDRGREQSEWLATTLSTEPVSAVYSSDLSRAAYAADLIAAKHGLQPIKQADLREINMGEWDGKKASEIYRQSPELLASLFENPLEFQYPGGESFREFEKRVKDALVEIRFSHPSSTVVIVGHGGVCRMILGQALELPPRNWLRIAQAHACINTIEWFNGFPMVTVTNYRATVFKG
jgi:broad specificity phosphatase PhoE